MFAAEHISGGELIEVAPLLRLNCKVDDLQSIGLGNHYYDGPSIGLGFAAIYNHSETPNAACFQYPRHLEFVAVTDIKNGDEVTFNYQKIVHKK